MNLQLASINPVNGIAVIAGMRQRIPTLNLNLILNPKLDLISKLITVVLLPTRPQDPIYAHSHSRISTLSHPYTLVCSPVVRCWEGHLGPSQSKRARVHASSRTPIPTPPPRPPTARTQTAPPPPRTPPHQRPTLLITLLESFTERW